MSIGLLFLAIQTATLKIRIGELEWQLEPIIVLLFEDDDKFEMKVIDAQQKGRTPIPVPFWGDTDEKCTTTSTDKINFLRLSIQIHNPKSWTPDQIVRGLYDFLDDSIHPDHESDIEIEIEETA
jgi:hypothetical protein